MKSLRARVVVLCAAIFLPLTTASGASLFPSPSGVWLSDGYGRVARFEGNALQWYQITQISCVRTARVQRQGGSAAEADYEVDGDVFRLTQGPAADTLWSHEDDSVSSVLLKRTQAMPEVCNRPTPDTPAENYAIFWQTFEEHYPFFAVRKMDWQAVDRTYRPRVTATTSPTELFAILRQMIEPLHDAHTHIESEKLKLVFGGYRPSEDPRRKQSKARIDEIIATKYMHGGLRDFCQKQLQFGMLAGSIAYLRINNFGGYCAGTTFVAIQDAFDSALDTIFKDAGQWRGLVIDVRINGGGADPLGISIAQRLALKDYLAYSKVVRNDVHDADHRTAPQPVMVHPSPRPGFRGPVVLLTSTDSVSAAETFTMALQDRAPHIVRVGANTQGVFSDVLARRLPNGWTFFLPNEIYLDRTGKAYDVTGVPPDIALTPFAADDLAAGRDSDLDEALRILASKPAR